MSVYVEIVTANNLSTYSTQIDDAFEAVRSFERGTVTPGVLVTGAIWEKTDYAWAGGAGSAWMRYNGSSHVLFADPRSPLISAAGTIPMAADLPMGGNKITGLADGTASGHAATVGQMSTLAAAAWTANHDANGKLLINLGAPTTGGNTSDQVAARIDDTWQTTHGLHRYIDAPVFDTVFGSGVTTGNAVIGGKHADLSATPYFCPRHLHLMLSGNVTPIGGGGAALTLSVETHFDGWRHSGNAGAWVSVGTIGSGFYGVEVYFQTSGTLGFAMRIRRLSDNALFESAVKHAWAFSGVGMA